jgi:penicillin-binding protein A
MYSSPSFDPNGVAANDSKVSGPAADALGADKKKPNQNRTISETYAPGSIFKVVTAAAALDSGKFTERAATQADPNVLGFPGGFSIRNENRETCPGTDLKTALQASCNTVFGYVGEQLGVNTMTQTAEQFGLNDPSLTVPLNVVQSVFPTQQIGNDPSFLAQSSIGQYSTRMTPLQAAMIAAAVADGGTLMKPYLVQKEISPRGNTTSTAKPEVLHQAMTPATAQILDDMMVNVVTNGTGTNAQIPGVKVGGKTGTAQRGQTLNPLAWFISYASVNDKKVAVAVLVQDDNANQRDDISGGGFAAPVAKQVMETALGVAPQ